MSSVPLYDRFSQNYDLFITWDSRLEDEAPFFEDLFAANNVRSVLDVGCGTGMHPVMFAKWGLKVCGADLSEPMIAKAKANAKKAGVKIRFVRSGFEELPTAFPTPFDVVTCLGNSLPHVLTDKELLATLEAFHAVLRPEGMLVIHNLNYDRLEARKQRFLNPKHAHRGERDFLFLRFFDFPERSRTTKSQPWTFNVVTLMQEDKQWRLHMEATEHRPLKQKELATLMGKAGFEGIQAYGDYQQEPFNATDSSLLLMVGKKKK